MNHVTRSLNAKSNNSSNRLLRLGLAPTSIAAVLPYLTYTYLHKFAFHGMRANRAA